MKTSEEETVRINLKFRNFFTKYYKKKDSIGFFSFCVYLCPNNDFKIKDINFLITDDLFKPKFYLSKGITIKKNLKFNFYKVEFSIEKLIRKDIQNKILIKINDDINSNPVKYSFFDRKLGKNKNSKVWRCKKENTSIYFRQSVKNYLYVTVREIKKTDKLIEQIKINFSYFCSKMFIHKNLVLLYEKESSKYEESASVLFENLVDKGYKNIYYILEKNSIYKNKIDKKYLKNIINKGSFKHYLYFFKTKKFIGTETIAHALELRVANRFAVNKISDKNNEYVFLQHGVMYMISLNSDLRTGFNNDDKKLFRVVVSSKLEAKHFMELGNFDSSNLYITGLPKYDKNTWNYDADKIVIMPTWRRWEYNLLRKNFELTNYYKMIDRMIKAIPKKYHDKIIVLPHPLFINFIKNDDSYLNKFIPDNFMYDEILKDTKLLITDYSSIAYDAFYRGSNVIFYWEEKNECLVKYGSKAKLMLNEKNVFGDIANSPMELSNIFEKNYIKKQDKKYIKRYSKIIEFNDNKNTERVVELLLKDGIIKK